MTGASRGIGRATALQLAHAGSAVAVNYRRNETGVEKTANEIVESAADIAAMFATGRERFGRLDTLVLNAAATAFRPLLETRDHNVERTFGISVTGFLRCVREGVPLMDGGAIVGVSASTRCACCPATARSAPQRPPSRRWCGTWPSSSRRAAFA